MTIAMTMPIGAGNLFAIMEPPESRYHGAT